MSVVQERCPACSAPLPIQPGERRLKCPYCGSALSIERQGDAISLELANRVLGSLEESGALTQAEFRRLRLTQELAAAEMRLANLQSEQRSIKRGAINAVSRTQLQELHTQEITLRQQIASLQTQLTPNAQVAPVAPKRVGDWRMTPQRIGWLLFSITGRANRGEFWAGVLVCVGIYLAFVIVMALSRALPNGDGLVVRTAEAILSFVALVQGLTLLWVGVAVAAKRFHDRDKAGWWVLIGLIPMVGLVWFLVELGLLPGTPGGNRYG